MKKRSVLCLLCLLLLLSACGAEPSSEAEARSFFYYPSESSAQEVLFPAPSPADPAQLSPEAFLKAYLEAAEPENVLPILPEAWRFDSFSMEGSAACLKFTGAKTSPLRRSLSLACLTKTLLQHPQIRSVSILSPESEQPTLLTENDILLRDVGMEPQQAQITLYFPDGQRRYLISEARSMDDTDKPTFILQELLSEEGNCIPAGTRLLSVGTENGVCTVNLSSEFVLGMERSFSAERMAVYSIVNSLTELPEISTVDIWVSGAPLERLNFLDLSQGISRDESLFFNPFAAEYADLSVYALCPAEGLLAELPLLMEAADKSELAGQAVQALISMEEKNGLKNPIPAGTKLLSVRMENSTCVLDFTGEFLAGCHTEEEEAIAVRAAIATVCSIDGISAVEILVEGIEPAFRNGSLSSLRRVQKDWILP